MEQRNFSRRRHRGSSSIILAMVRRPSSSSKLCPRTLSNRSFSRQNLLEPKAYGSCPAPNPWFNFGIISWNIDKARVVNLYYNWRVGMVEVFQDNWNRGIKPLLPCIIAWPIYRYILLTIRHGQRNSLWDHSSFHIVGPCHYRQSTKCRKNQTLHFNFHFSASLRFLCMGKTFGHNCSRNNWGMPFFPFI